MNGSDTETNTLAKQGVLLQSRFERTLGNIIHWCGVIYVRNSCFNWDATLVGNNFKGDVEKIW